MGPPWVFLVKKKSLLGARGWLESYPWHLCGFASKIPINTRRVNENVEQIAPVGRPAEFNEDQRFSLTAETVPDIFISQGSA